MATLRLLLVAALLALPLWVAQTAPAHACSFSLRDQIRDTELIAVGTMGEMLVLPPESVAHPDSLFGKTPVEIKFSSVEYLKGSGPSDLLVFQPAAQIAYNDGQIVSILDNELCGQTFTRGDDYILLLTKVDTLRYSMDTAGNRPADPDTMAFFVSLIAEVDAEQVGGLPPAGSGPTHHSAPVLPLIAASALAGIGLAANAAFALRRRSSL